MRTCKYCGCTDDDCTQCILLHGAPCYWVETNSKESICSSCSQPITIQQFLKSGTGFIFARGVMPNDSSPNHPIIWIAIKSRTHGVNDWAIYSSTIGYRTTDIDRFICDYGIKIKETDKIKQLINMEPELINYYRY